MMCQVVSSWKYLLKAARVSRRQCGAFHQSRSFQYDLVNLGREVLAQLSTPMAMNFSDATSFKTLDHDTISMTGWWYRALLLDLDSLVGTDGSFRLEEAWLQPARAIGNGFFDCELPATIMTGGDWEQRRKKNRTNCEFFYEWNARTQLNTWNPVLSPNAAHIPGGPIDYAAKHWHQLIRECYVRRIQLVQDQALKDASLQNPLNQTAVDQLLAQHAYNWTLLEVAIGGRRDEDGKVARDALDYIDISVKMFEKYISWFKDPCSRKTNPNSSPSNAMEAEMQ